MFQDRKPLIGQPAGEALEGALERLRVADALCGNMAAELPLLRAMPVAVYLVDAAGQPIFANAVARETLGLGTVEGRPPAGSWQFVDRDGAMLGEADLPVARAMRQRSPVLNAEVGLNRPDGSRLWFRSNATPLFDDSGQVSGAMDVMVDISDQHDAEVRLAESEAHYRHAIELNPQMPWTADPAGNVLDVNERWCQITGQSEPSALRGGWATVANPDDMPALFQQMARCAATGEPLDVRFRAMVAGGGERWMRARARARHDENGEIVRWYGSTEDIHDAVCAEQALVAAEERYRYAALATKDVFWDHDLRTDRIVWSDGLEETFGHRPDEEASAGTFWLGNVHPADRERVGQSLQQAIAAGANRWTSEYRFQRADGSYADVLDCGTLLRDQEGTVVRAIGAMLDFSHRKQTEADLRLSEERLRLALEAAGLGIADFDAVTGTEHWSDELRGILGLRSGTPSGVRTWLSIVHPDDLPGALEQHRRTRASDFGHGFRATRRIIRPVDGEIRWISTEGHVLRDPAGRVYRVILTVRDVTEEKLAQDRVRWAATHDALTTLPNKGAFQEALADAVGREAEQPVSLLLVDLDNFKLVNDTLGHQAGDALLVEVGRRLQSSLPKDAMVARFGGDEFAVILPDVGREAASDAAQGALDALRPPCPIAGSRSVDVRASIGVATFPRDGENGSTLLQAADIALYAAKSAGRCTVRLYASEMRAGLQLQVSTIRQARDALGRGAIVPFYQPKVCLSSGRTVGAEALLRWMHPRHGLQEAGSILAALDDPEMGEQIGLTMIRAVLTDMRMWLNLGEQVGRVAINISPVQASRTGFADQLLGSILAADVPCRLVEVEVTETALMGTRVEQVVEELRTLRSSDVTVALDDFGTGYSSLSHLARLPVDVIKIDRSFVAAMTSNRADRAVVDAVLGLSTAMGLTTVAEGVETARQAALLKTLGCELAQGFLFSRAVPGKTLDWGAVYKVDDEIGVTDPFVGAASSRRNTNDSESGRAVAEAPVGR